MPKDEKEYHLEMDAEGNIISIDTEILQLLGYSGDEGRIEDLTIFDIVFEGDLDQVMACMASDQGGPSGPYEIRLFSRTGERLKVKAYPEKVVVGGRLEGIRCRFMLMDG